MPCVSYSEEDAAIWALQEAQRSRKQREEKYRLECINEAKVKERFGSPAIPKKALTNLGSKAIRKLKVENAKLESLLCESFQLLIDNNIDIRQKTNLYEFYLRHKQKDEGKIFVPVLCSKCHIELNQYYSIINTETYHGYLCSECYADS